MLRSPNMRKPAEQYAKEHGFIIDVTPAWYIVTHPTLKNYSAHCKTYGTVLTAMKSKMGETADGGNPVAIEAAGQSVAVIQREFDDLVAPAWRRPIAERLKLDDLPTIADRASMLPPPDPRTMLMKPDGEKDVRMFYVMARFKKGEHVTHGSLTRDKAFEYAGIFLTNPRVKSVKLGPM